MAVVKKDARYAAGAGVQILRGIDGKIRVAKISALNCQIGKSAHFANYWTL